MSEAKTSTNAAAWFEIGVKNLEAGARFYGAVLGSPLKAQEMGPQPTMIFPYDGGVGGHLYQTADVGAASLIVHFNAPAPLEGAMERVKKSGGKVVSEIRAIPDGRYVYCQDPDGTRFGLFTAD